MRQLAALVMTTLFALPGGTTAYAEAEGAEMIAESPQEASVASRPATSIAQSLPDESLRTLVDEVLRRNPNLVALHARASAAAQMAPQVRALPDPTASLTYFLSEPETRVGPQRAATSLMQPIPWLSKLSLREQIAVFEALAADQRWEAARLEMVTKVRHQYYELQYLDKEQSIIRDDQTTLEHYEELAQARYASGVGLDQAVIKIQAEITRARTRLIQVEVRRNALVASLNALRDRPESAAVMIDRIHESPELTPDSGRLRKSAEALRPEVTEKNFLIEAAKKRIDLARADYRPDFAVGLSYTAVDERDDAMGRLSPPEGNGRDVVGLTGSIRLPVWRKKLAAGLEEALEKRIAAEEERRSVLAGIEGALGDMTNRIPLLNEQLQLFDEILIAQAEHSLLSAESAYAAGTASALDLLDAERVLLGIRLGAERTRTDLNVAIASLEGVVAHSLATNQEHGRDR